MTSKSSILSSSLGESDNDRNLQLRWYDKKIWGVAYSTSTIQIIMVSFVCFLAPGMYNALSGLGGTGIDDLSVSNNASVALYCCFATIGFFSGTVCNIIGVRYSLMFGATGYALYTGSLLCWNHQRNPGFVIFGGAYLGVCASLLWAAQGTIIMSYPTESKKGRAIMIFWVIFNLGAVIGSIIPLAANMHSTTNAANDSTFIAFLVLMIFASFVSLCLLPSAKVWRTHVGGERVANKEYPNWKVEIIMLFKLLKDEPTIFLLFPMFFSSNWFYTYQFNDVNAARFNIRTRSLNSLLYWITQMVGAIAFGCLLDWKKFSRSARTKIGWTVLLVLTLAIWGGGLKFQLGYTRESNDKLIDFTDSKEYVGPVFLYIFYGLFDSVWQTYIYYLLGALSNNPKKAALYGGFYKGLQSAGAAVAWRLDYYEVKYIAMFGSSWGMLIASLLFAAPLVFFRIRDHTSEEDQPEEAIMEDITLCKSEVEEIEGGDNQVKVNQ